MIGAALLRRSAVPYKELDFFEDTTEDRSNFAGRDHDIQEVVARIATTRAFVLYARSGLGKTSLLRAGVFPLLREDGFFPIYIRTLETPLDELDAALRNPDKCPLSPPASPKEPLEALLARLAASHTPVLVFDQFEEFFTRAVLRGDGHLKKRRDRATFVNRVSKLAVDSAPKIHVVFSLREDYLHALDAFQRRLPDLFNTAYRLLPLTAASARDAVIAPLLRGKIPFQEGLITDLIDQLAEFDFDSARLQIACAEIYRAAAAPVQGGEPSTRQPLLNEAHLELIADNGKSGLRSVFRRYLQEAIGAIDSKYHLLARALLDHLFAAKGTKYALTLSGLVGLRFGAPRATCGVLWALWRQKILRRERREGGVWYELRHECLVEAIEEWLNEDETFANYRLVRDIIKANTRDERFRDKTALLLSEDQLARLVSPNKESFRLNQVEKEFVLLSAIYESSYEYTLDTEWWIGQVGRERSETMTVSLLRTGANDKMRRGAAVAARFLCPDPAKETVGKCLALALDPSQPVDLRRDAGRSFAALAGGSELESFRHTLPRWRRSEPQRDLLMILHEHGKLGQFRLLTRRLAQRRFAKARVDQSVASIREGGVRGFASGMAGAVMWTLSTGLAWVWLVASLFPDALSKMFLFLIIVGVAALTCGAIVGPLAARSGRKVKAVEGTADWSLAVRRSVVVFLLGAAASSWLVALLLEDVSWPLVLQLGLAVGLLLAIGLGVRRVLGAAVGLTRTCLLGASGAARLVWIVVAAFCLTFTIPLILTSLAAAPAARSFAGLSFVEAMLLALAPLAVLMPIASCALSGSDGDLEAPPTGAETRIRDRNRWLLAAGASLAVVWIGMRFNHESLYLPLALQRTVHETGGKVEWGPRLADWPMTARATPVSDSHLFEVTAAPDEAQLYAGETRVSPHYLVVLPDKSRSILLSNLDGPYRSLSGQVELKVKETSPSVPPDAEEAFVQVSLSPKGAQVKPQGGKEVIWEGGLQLPAGSVYMISHISNDCLPAGVGKVIGRLKVLPDERAYEGDDSGPGVCVWPPRSSEAGVASDINRIRDEVLLLQRGAAPGMSPLEIVRRQQSLLQRYRELTFARRFDGGQSLTFRLAFPYDQEAGGVDAGMPIALVVDVRKVAAKAPSSQ
jgi:hypothetical protein